MPPAKQSDYNGPEPETPYQHGRLKVIILLIRAHGRRLPVHCERCGYNKTWRALTFEHPKGDGAAARREGRHSLSYFRAHPKKILVYCANCQMLKAQENGEYQGGLHKG